MEKIDLEKFSKLIEHETPILLVNENGDILFDGYFDLFDENSSFSYWFEDFKKFYVLGIGFAHDDLFDRYAVVITIFMEGKRINKIGVSQVQFVAPGGEK